MSGNKAACFKSGGKWPLLGFAVSVLTLSLGLYLTFTLPKLNRMYMAEEAMFVGYVNGMTGVIDLRAMGGGHPPLYTHLLRIGYSLSSGSAYGLRAIGLISTLATLVFIYLATNRLIRESLWLRNSMSLFAVAVFALLPTTVQGTLHLDIDNTVLTLVSTALEPVLKVG